jgi:hypothetical protein
VAPWVAGKLGENVSVHAPFWMGAGVVLIAVAVLAAGRRYVERGADQVPAHASREEAEAVAVGDLD